MQLTNEQKLIGRRNFIKAVGTLPAVGAFAMTATNVGPVKAGIVGSGVEGRMLMSVMDPSYLYMVALCDIRPDSRKLGRDIIVSTKHSPNPKIYEKYEEMLADPEIEAIVIATPLKYHGPMAIEALRAGKHVFTEKTMAYDLKDCQDMVQLAKEKNLNLQVGHQRFYNPLYWDAYRMCKDGLLGSIYHIRALWHRNNDWNHWVHVPRALLSEAQSFNPQPFDYPDMQHLVNWRWYNKYSHGFWTELCSHQMAITNWIFGKNNVDAMPAWAMAYGDHQRTQEQQDQLYKSGVYASKVQFEADRDKAKAEGTDFPWNTFEEYRNFIRGYSKDDREIDDHIYAIFGYPEGQVVTYSSISSNAFDRYYEQIMGTRGTIILSRENEYYLFWEPGWDESKSKQAEAAKATGVDVAAEDAGGAAFAAYVSGEATGGGGSSDMSPYDPYRWELQGFAHTIRTGAPNLCDGTRGMKAAAASFAGKESIDQNGAKITLEAL